ncbi:peptidoglycan-binding protein [Litorimonas sp. WD9-15]|uniref:peptidoglycan-binding protein n=1 Tax=Litorimonas sp. WD9-15 TaxID=3418716 RepID=UPI003D08DB74
MSSQTAKSTTKRAKKPVKRPTVAGLAAELKTLESRLKRTNTAHQKAFKDLQEVVTNLASSAGKTSPVQKAALTRGLNTLEKKLKSDFAATTDAVRSDIRNDLAQVTQSGAGVYALNEALMTANARLDAHESEQRDAIAKLNRHIADMAVAVDARLSNETKARQTSMAEITEKLAKTESLIGKRIDRVEDDTAEALNRIGDKVAEFAAVLDERAHKSDAETAERLADLAQETQAEFNSTQTDVATRLEALETIAAEWSPTPQAQPYPTAANNDDPRIDYMSETLGQLQEEISRLHARLAAVQSGREVESNVVPMAQPPAQAMAAPQRSASLPTLRDDNPYATTYPSEEKAAPSKRESHVPVEFDPQAFVAPQNPDLMPPPASPTQIGNFEVSGLPPAPQMPPQLPPMASAGGYNAPTPPPMMNALAPINAPTRAPEPVMAYDNPAYADEMRAERVGGETSRKPSLPSLGKLPVSGRNLRLGALVAGVAVIGVIAARSILGGDPIPDQRADLNTVPNANIATESGFATDEILLAPTAGEESFANVADQPIESTPPLGNYAETTVPTISNEGQTTLDAAVKAGNPIAQFQMGLNKLQAGDPEEAARLIRLSANRNQPAAQYRLAKLYESGTGVAQDDVTARELVERAAIGGNRIAMHDLGNYYFYGQGDLTRDPAAALDWFRKAAERGVVDSQFNVGFLREGGQGVSEDLSVAYFWYNIAARQGDQGAPGRVAAIGPKLDEATRKKIEADAARFTPKPVDEAANGLFRDVPWATQTAKTPNPARAARIQRIKTAQTLLTDLGFDIGGADGAAGPKTKSAIREFEKVNGLPETGAVTDELIQRLEVATGV